MTHPLAPFAGVYDHLIVHATATSAAMTEVDAEWVDRLHRSKGWSGNGYHAVITREGELQWEPTGHRTRKLGTPGAHVGGCGPGWNRRSLGVSLAGGVADDGLTPEDNYTDDQMQALWDFVEGAKEALDIPEANIMGHRDLIKLTGAAPKACPCFSVRTWRDGTGLADYESVVGRMSFSKRKPRKETKVDLRSVYTVRKGDTLWGISRATGVPVRDLTRFNKLTSTVIQPGQELRLLH